MSSFSFFDQYMPAVEAIPPTVLQQETEKLRTWMRTNFPDVDNRSGSLFDLSYQGPAAGFLAALTVAVGRLRQDLDVQGVAAGNMTDCDFIRSYLPALGGVQQESVNTVGYVLVTFTADQDYELPSGWQVSFGVDSVFSLFNPTQDGLRIMRRGSTPESARDYVLHTVSTGVYGVILPVQGVAQDAVAAGTTAEVSVVIEGLSTVTAFADFQAGRANNSVAAMAARVVGGFNTRDFSTPGSTRELLLSIWPDLEEVVVKRAGDSAVTRSGNNVLGIQQGVVDAWLTSQHRDNVVTEQVVLYYDAATDKFVNTWVPAAVPSKFLTVQWTGDAALDLGAADSLLVYRSLNARAPRLELAGSADADYTFVVPMPRDGADPEIMTQLDGLARPYAVFAVQYVAEPAVLPIQRYVDAMNPLGLSLKVRAPARWQVSSLVCNVSKKAGAQFNEAQCRSEIVAALRTKSQATGVNLAPIVDAVYYAGAERMNYVQLAARVSPVPCSTFVPYGTTDALEDVAAFEALREPVPTATASSIDGMNLEIDAPDVGSYVGSGTTTVDISPDAVAFNIQNI